ncbi:hypothetical protein T484DRAFT_1930315 [Baffinella frigidus]|nr:hypothetical protein T484DRAFT_1930315 [Cryptophyta sp. CCMP2293]
MIYGLWFMVHGVWFKGQGSWFRVSGLRGGLGALLAHLDAVVIPRRRQVAHRRVDRFQGVQVQILSDGQKAQGGLFMVYGLWFMVYVVWFLVYVVWFLVSGFWFRGQG